MIFYEAGGGRAERRLISVKLKKLQVDEKPSVPTQQDYKRK